MCRNATMLGVACTRALLITSCKARSFPSGFVVTWVFRVLLDGQEFFFVMNLMVNFSRWIIMRMKINRMKKTCLLTSLWEPNWHLYKLEPLVSGKARSFHSLPNSIIFLFASEQVHVILVGNWCLQVCIQLFPPGKAALGYTSSVEIINTFVLPYWVFTLFTNFWMNFQWNTNVPEIRNLNSCMWFEVQIKPLVEPTRIIVNTSNIHYRWPDKISASKSVQSLSLPLSLSHIVYIQLQIVKCDWDNQAGGFYQSVILVYIET